MVLNKKALDKAFSPKKLGVRRMPDGPSGTQTSTCSPTMPSHIKVFVRVRPFNERENAASSSEVVKVVDETMLVFDPVVEDDGFFFHGVQQKGRDLTKKAKKDLAFTFDRVFGDTSTNEEVHCEVTKDIVNSLFEGYNCSIFAYGATGAGKTFTMLGSHFQPGIIYMTIVELLNYIETNADRMNVTLGATYIEVYNENVRDLLNPDSPSLYLRDSGGQVTITGLQIEAIRDPDQLFQLLEKGNTHRSQHPTDSNKESSRSHAIFQVHLRIVLKDRRETKLAKLSMIDLAGSERGVATGCSGDRFKEGSNINRSLLALGNCINALADGLGHIPYRDSKLTRILKDSLGGNCRTVMVANVSPATSAYEDTHNTLRYAFRARAIKSKLSRNVISGSMTSQQLKRRIEELETENKRLKGAEAAGTLLEEVSELQEIKEVMAEKFRLTESLLTLEVGAKMIDWRLMNKESRVAQMGLQSTAQGHVGDPTGQQEDQASDQVNTTYLCTEGAKKPDTPTALSVVRMNAGMEQLRGRTAGISDRKAELLSKLAEVEAKESTLLQNIKASLISKILLSVHSEWVAKIELLKGKFECRLSRKQLMVEMKEKESMAVSLDAIVPLLRLEHGLLRAHNHLTHQLQDTYQAAMRTLEGVKGVTFGDDGEGGVGGVEKAARVVEGQEKGGPAGRAHLLSLASFTDPPPRPPTPTQQAYGGSKTIGKSSLFKTTAPLRTRNTSPSRSASKGGLSRLSMKSGKIMKAKPTAINKENHGPAHTGRGALIAKPIYGGGLRQTPGVTRKVTITGTPGGSSLFPAKSPGFNQKGNVLSSVFKQTPKFPKTPRRPTTT